MKILITSDTHINHFGKHNILGDARFRLKQYETLSQRLVQIIKQENAEAVMIAGDLLHVASPRPYVVNAAAKFLKTISKVSPIFVIHGQHDFDSRTLMTDDNSLLNVLGNIDNVRYMNEESVILDGRSFYFKGWTHNQDFSKIKKDQYDVLIGHATINTAIMNSYGTVAVGPEFDNTKFRLCFIGDIHKPQVIGNIVIPGPPIQANAGDNSDNSVIILDTKDLTWKRVETETKEFRFIKFITSDKESDDPYTIVRKPRTAKANVKELITKSVDVLDVIDKCVTSNNLKQLHEKISNVTSKLEEDELDLNFTIENLKCTNFKSIEELDWKPPIGVSLIVGKIGTGKSTLIKAIRFALQDHRKPASLVRIGQTEMKVEITISYGGNIYRIERGYAKKTGYLKYFVNEGEIEIENKPEGNRRIAKDLQFMTLFNALYRSQDNIYFLESQSYGERVEMISKVVRLSITDRLKKSAEDLQSPLKIDLDKNTILQKTLSSYVDNFKDIKFAQSDVLYDDQIKTSTIIVSQLNLLIDLEKKFEIANTEISKLSYGLTQFDQYDFSDLESKLSNVEIESVTIQAKIADISKEILSTKKEVSEVNIEVNARNSELVKLQSEYIQLDAKSKKISNHLCYTCEQIIDQELTQKLRSDTIKDQGIVKSKIETVKTALSKAENDFSQINIKLERLNEKNFLLAEIKNKIVLEFSKLTTLNKSYKIYLKTLEDLNISKKRKEEAEAKLLMFRKSFFTKHSINVDSATDTINLHSEHKDKVTLYTEKKQSQEQMKTLKEDLDQKRKSLDQVNFRINKLIEEIEQYDKYIFLMSSKGEVVRSVLTTVSENMSNDNVKVVAHKTLANEETRPDFNVYLKVAHSWIEYDELSGGQKNVCDVFVLNHLIDMAGGAGTLILDETFCQVGFEDLEFSIEILKNMKVNHIFVISHHDNFPAYDNLIMTNFDNETGITTYNTLRG